VSVYSLDPSEKSVVNINEAISMNETTFEAKLDFLSESGYQNASERNHRVLRGNKNA
jgi:hypothetical protein